MKSRSRFSRIGILSALYAGTLFFSLHYFLIIYVSSSFLEDYITPTSVGFLYTLAALVSIPFFVSVPKILKRFGNYRVMMTLGVIEICSLLFLALSKNVSIILLSFIVHQTMVTLMSICSDVFLESYSKDGSTGRLRAILFTVVNIAAIVSTFAAGLIVAAYGFSSLFMLAAVTMLPFIFLIKIALRDFKDPEYKAPRLLAAIRALKRNRNLYGVFMASFLLQLFYAFMVIYTPIYLHAYLNFSWAQIGLIFTIMILPFLIFELPLGFIADMLTGEKEIMIIGFCIMGGATMLISFLTLPSVAMFASILFLTRVGASFVEMMTESYFFKQVSERDVDIVGLYRITSPLSFIVAPPVVALILYVLPYHLIFISVGLLMLYGVRYASMIKDTR